MGKAGPYILDETECELLDAFRHMRRDARRIANRRSSYDRASMAMSVRFEIDRTTEDIQIEYSVRGDGRGICVPRPSDRRTR